MEIGVICTEYKKGYEDELLLKTDFKIVIIREIRNHSLLCVENY